MLEAIEKRNVKECVSSESVFQKEIDGVAQKESICFFSPCSKLVAGSHNEAISFVVVSPSNKAIYEYHLWDIASLQYDRFCTNESVLFISDILLYCSVI